jgi:YfiH family protein
MNAPTPDPTFRWSVEPWGLALRCQPLESAAQHLFTTRQLELRASRDVPAQVRRQTSDSEDGWVLAARSVGGEVGRLMRLRQVHGRGVRVLRRDAIDPVDAAARAEADAMVSDAPGVVLAVQVADCVPILISNPGGTVVAAVHAGWRGTAAGVARAAIRTMGEEFGTPADELLVAFGPSISPCCYEVGSELIDAFRTGGASDEQIDRWFTRTPSGSLRLDVAAANVDQIQAAGVARDRIFQAGLCTKTHNQWFDSYRAAGPRAGRMAGLIRVRQ